MPKTSLVKVKIMTTRKKMFAVYITKKWLILIHKDLLYNKEKNLSSKVHNISSISLVSFLFLSHISVPFYPSHQPIHPFIHSSTCPAMLFNK